MTKKPDSNKFIAEQYGELKNKLEQKTGYHFDVKSKKNGAEKSLSNLAMKLNLMIYFLIS